jgi:cytochrome c
MNKLAFAVALTGVIAAAPALASPELAKSKKCMECHDMDKEGKGPSFKAIAKLHRGTEKAEAKIAEKMKKGGAEHWGPNVMPSAEARAVTLSDAEAKTLAEWVLKQK